MAKKFKFTIEDLDNMILDVLLEDEVEKTEKADKEQNKMDIIKRLLYENQLKSALSVSPSSIENKQMEIEGGI